MRSKREIRQAVAPTDQLVTLNKLTDEALALHEIKPVLDPETTQEEIKRRIAEQASQILGDAETDYANYEAARALAEHVLGRADYLAWGIFGITAGYILATGLLASPRPVYGLTAAVTAVLTVVLIVRRGVVSLRHQRLFRGLTAARGRWIDGLRDQALLPFILQKLNDLTQDSVLYAAFLNPDVPPRLVERSEPRRLVASEAMDRIGTIAESMRDGSLGISGPAVSERPRLFVISAMRRTISPARLVPLIVISSERSRLRGNRSCGCCCRLLSITSPATSSSIYLSGSPRQC